jgi:hypothetical protein
MGTRASGRAGQLEHSVLDAKMPDMYAIASLAFSFNVFPGPNMLHSLWPPTQCDKEELATLTKRIFLVFEPSTFETAVIGAFEPLLLSSALQV